MNVFFPFVPMCIAVMCFFFLFSREHGSDHYFFLTDWLCLRDWLGVSSADDGNDFCRVLFLEFCHLILLFLRFVVFTIGRRLMRSWVMRRLENFPKLRRLERAISDRWTAVRLNVLMCFGPFPFAIHVHFFAVTEMHILAFLSSFAIGVISFFFFHFSPLGSLATWL